MDNFPKTLLLCRNIPPAPTGASVVIANLAKQFRSDEMVVLGAYYLNTPTQSWSREWPALKYAIVQFPDGWRGARWLRWIQFPLLFLRSWWTLLVHRCEAILVVYPDEIFLLVAYLLARLTGRSLYPYFHNTYLENRPNSRFASWLQPRVFAIASHVFVMSEGMRKLYRVNYPDLRCSALLHSFNQLLPRYDETVVATVHQPLRLVMFGNVLQSNSDAATRFAQLVRNASDLHLTVFSGTSRGYLKQLGFTGDNVTIKTVSYDVLMEGLKQSDIILLPHGFAGGVVDEEIATIFPTRTIEALISERPILAHTPGDCFLADFLRDHKCALIVDEPEVAMLKQAVGRLRQDPDLRARLVRQALLAAEQFQATTVAAHLRSILEGGVAASMEQQPAPIR
jgi:glycosyltransferase involved in cell wall biosynthesis